MTLSLNQLSTDWLHWSQKYRPLAFWFWNGAMHPERIEQVIETIAANNIPEFLLHPIHGLEIEYFSETFFQRVALTLELAKKHNLKVWIYDEYGWPSGNVGGKLLAQHPDYNGWFLHFSHDDQGQTVAQPQQCSKLMDNTMGAPWTQNEKGQLDTLRPDAVACYIDMCYAEYYRRFSDYFGSTIIGFFTDEPTDMTPDFTPEEGSHWQAPALPWTPEFPDLFRQKFNYDIEPLYPQLAQPEFLQAREDYWQLVKEIHSQAYHQQIGQWCRDHNVQYTGHLGEDALLMQVRYTGSVYQSLQHMDIPGVDQLLYRDDTDQRDLAQLTITSVTRHTGRQLTFCEAWGISPFDLRYSRMSHQMQMFAIHGVNQVALMAFHQQLDGARRYIYWPPMFDTTPAWPWFPTFSDTSARHLALGSLAPRRPRFAILYPQQQFEQTSPFVKTFDPDYPPQRTLEKITQAIYAAGESYEFIFDEILDQAHYQPDDRRIHFPHADYQTIIAPADLMYYPRNRDALAKLQADGASIYDAPADDIVAQLQSLTPSWAQLVKIEHPAAPASLRTFTFDYPDGPLLALRNVTEQDLTVTITPTTKIVTLWDAQTGSLQQLTAPESITLEPHSGLWLSLTDQPLLHTAPRPHYNSTPLDLEFSLNHEAPNLAPLQNIEFCKDTQWLPAQDDFAVPQPYPMLKSFVPHDFAGMTHIPFRGQFTTDANVDNLQIAFEKDHLHDLQINGNPVNLTTALPYPLWDHTTMLIDISPYIQPGPNTVTGTLAYLPFETQVRSDLFYGAVHPQVSCDVFIAGNFHLIDQTIQPAAATPHPLPLALEKLGLTHCPAPAQLSASFTLTPAQAQNARALELNLIEADPVELLCDGVSLGQKVHAPYIFNLPTLTPGSHQLTIRIAPTPGQLFYRDHPWGLQSLNLLSE